MEDRPTSPEDEEFQRLIRFTKASAEEAAGVPPTESQGAAAAGGSVRGHVHNRGVGHTPRRDRQPHRAAR